jgi:hypothetical protein
VVKSNLIVASIAFSVAATALHAADYPKPWAKKFTMSREGCSQRKIKFRQEHGMHPLGFSNMYANNVHVYASDKSSWVSKCFDRYGAQ